MSAVILRLNRETDSSSYSGKAHRTSSRRSAPSKSDVVMVSPRTSRPTLSIRESISCEGGWRRVVKTTMTEAEPSRSTRPATSDTRSVAWCASSTSTSTGLASEIALMAAGMASARC